MKDFLGDIFRDHGVFTIGLSGNEKSIYSLFDDLTSEAYSDRQILDAGLLWGVFIGENEDALQDPKGAAVRAVKNGEVNKNIKLMMERMSSAKNLFAFFPVRSASTFLNELIKETNDPYIRRSALPYYDHTMRLYEVFSQVQISPKTIRRHIAKLNFDKEGLIRIVRETRRSEPIQRSAINARGHSFQFCLYYSPITSEVLLTEARLRERGLQLLSAQRIRVSALEAARPARSLKLPELDKSYTTFQS